MEQVGVETQLVAVEEIKFQLWRTYTDIVFCMSSSLNRSKIQIQKYELVQHVIYILLELMVHDQLLVLLQGNTLCRVTPVMRRQKGFIFIFK